MINTTLSSLMYIKDYPHAKIVEEVRVLNCLAMDFNPIGRKKRLNDKFVGTYHAMTEKGPSHKFHLNLKEELIVQSPEEEKNGSWWIEQKSPETKKEEKEKPILGISFKLGKTTQRYLCAFYHEDGVMILIPSKSSIYSLSREDYDFSTCLFLVKESALTGQLCRKTIEEVYAFVKASIIRKMEDEEISKIAVTKADKAIFYLLLGLTYLFTFFIAIWSVWFYKLHMEIPFLGLTEPLPLWWFMVWFIATPLAFFSLVRWNHNNKIKRISEFRQTHSQSEIPDVSGRWKGGD